MFIIEFYETSSGRCDVFEIIEKLELKARSSKQNRIRFAKIVEYMRVLEKYGTAVGYPVVKYMGNGIWELRPLDDRFFFFSAKSNKYIFLHYCQKSKGKTPKRDLSLAITRMKDYNEREAKNV
jgi:phage-related protein